MSLRAVDQNIVDLLRIILKWSVQIKVIFFAQSFQNCPGEAAFIRTGLPPEGRDRPLVDGQAFVRNHQILVKFHLVSQSKTIRTGPEGVIEGKAPGLHLVDADPTIRTGEILAEIGDGSIQMIHHHQTASQREGCLDGVGKTFLDTVPHHQAVHHNLNIVFNVFVQSDLLGKLIEIPVNAHAHVAALSGVVQHLHVLSLPPSHHRGQDLDPASLRQRHDLIHHLINRLPADLSAALRAVGNADSGIKQSHIVVNLRHRPHRRPGIPVCGLLINGDCRGKSFNALHIRLLHLSQKLTGVGGEGLHISALAFRVNGVKGQG